MVTKPPWATRRTLKLSQFWDFVNELIQANWLMLAKLQTLLSQQDQIVAAEMHSRWMKRCHLSNRLPAPFPMLSLSFYPVYHLTFCVRRDATEESRCIRRHAPTSIHVSSISEHTWCMRYMTLPDWTDGQTERCCRHRGICYP